MKFSVIIPTYQGKTFIEDSIKSVFLQKSNFFDIEIIVVDDCSTDDTFEYLNQLTAKYDILKIFQQDKNGGPGMARNRGILESSGDYLFFLDDDDIFKEEAFQEVYNSLNLKSDIDVLYFNWEYDKKSSAKIYGYEGRDDLPLLEKSKKEIIESYLLNKIDCSVIYSVFSRKFLLKNNIRFREGIHEDIDFMFEIIVRSNNSLIIEKTLYVKNNRENSIVNSFSQKHILGYYGGLSKMYNLLIVTNNYKSFEEAFIKGVINVTASRIMRIFNLTEDDITREEMLLYLFQTVNELFDSIEQDTDYLSAKEFKTKYEMIFKRFLSYSKEGYENFMLFMNDIKDKSWSCFDLHNSIFLAPDEIRTCCKRYFHKDELKGDVVLLKGKDKEIFTYENILSKKINLFKEINRENAPECEGCPFLKFDKWGAPLEHGIKYLSFEYHSVCNMRCTYCSDTYYGGKESVYDIEKMIDSFKEREKISNIPYVIWGGGEPTLDKSFVKIIKILDSTFDTTKQRVITNAVKYVPELKELIDKNKAYIVTSIDAGTVDTFKLIRGISQIDKVLSNLKIYSNDNPHNIIIKYLLLDNNKSFEEIGEFINLINKYELNECNFQISYNFKSDIIGYEDLESIAYLYCLLLKNGAEFIFLDDLIWQRLKDINSEQFESILLFLEKHGLSAFIAKKSDYSNVIVWGTGAQADLIMRKSYFFKNVFIDFFVDPRKEVIGKEFFNKTIKSPNSIVDSSLPVFIGAVQSAPLIYQQYKEHGYDTNLIIKKLVL